MVPLGEVLTERQEVPSVDALANGRIRIIAKIGFNDGDIHLRTDVQTKTRMILIRPGDFVISGINAAKGAIAVYGEENTEPIAATIHYGAYIPNKKRVNIRYLWWLLRSDTFRDLLLEYVPGGIKTELKAKRLLPIPIPLPPLDEQRRIVARIEELAALIEEARGLRVKARKEAQALLDSALYEVFATAETEEWDYKLVKKLCEKPQYGYTESAQLERVGPKFLRITDIQNGTVNWDTVPYCACDDADKYRLKPGDILFARTGATTGKSFLVKECPETVFASYLIRLRLQPGLEPEYLYWFFQSPQYWSQVHEVKKGSAQANMNGQKLSNIAVPVAPSQEERKRIVAYLDGLQAQVDELTAWQDATQAELEALLPAVLDKAFRGEL
jgi:type I restriction enzyme S subunit